MPSRTNRPTQPSPAPQRPNVVVRGTSYLEVHGSVSVAASESAIVSVYGDADVHASGNATVIVWSGHTRVTLADGAVLVDRSPATPITRGAT